MIGARLGLQNGRVECQQIVDLRAVFGRSVTQNSALKCGRSSGILPRATRVGSLDRADSARSNEPTFVERRAKLFLSFFLSFRLQILLAVEARPRHRFWPDRHTCTTLTKTARLLQHDKGIRNRPDPGGSTRVSHSS